MAGFLIVRHEIHHSSVIYNLHTYLYFDLSGKCIKVKRAESVTLPHPNVQDQTGESEFPSLYYLESLGEEVTDPEAKWFR